MKHEWNKTQIKALKSSILHWERMRDNKRRKFQGALEMPYDTDCACCRKFMYGDNDGLCNKCPISIKAKKTGCNGTPYNDAANAFDVEGIETVAFRKAAQKTHYFRLQRV